MPTFDDATIRQALNVDTINVSTINVDTIINGLRAPRRYIQAPDMNISFIGKNYDIILIPSTITAPRAYEIDDTGAVDGDLISFFTQSTITSSINKPGGSLIAAIQVSSGVAFRVDVMRIGGTWTLVGLNISP